MGIKAAFVGPHEGQELELMVAGLKPLSMFVDFMESDVDSFSEAEFDKFVSDGKLIKHISFEKSDRTGAPDIRRVLYALPGEE